MRFGRVLFSGRLTLCGMVGKRWRVKVGFSSGSTSGEAVDVEVGEWVEGACRGNVSAKADSRVLRTERWREEGVDFGEEWRFGVGRSRAIMGVRAMCVESGREKCVMGRAYAWGWSDVSRERRWSCRTLEPNIPRVTSTDGHMEACFIRWKLELIHIHEDRSSDDISRTLDNRHLTRLAVFGSSK